MVPPAYYVALSAVLFSIGVVGVLVRRNPLVIFMSIELMLNAANLSFLAASRHWASVPGGEPLHGPIFALFVILVAAAEAAVGLALVIALYRLRQTVALDAKSELGG